MLLGYEVGINANNALCCFPEILTEKYVFNPALYSCTSNLLPLHTNYLSVTAAPLSLSPPFSSLAPFIIAQSKAAKPNPRRTHPSNGRGRKMMVVMVSNITFLGCWMILEGLATGSVIICLCIPPIWTGFFYPSPLVTVKLTQLISTVVCFWGTPPLPLPVQTSYVHAPK